MFQKRSVPWMFGLFFCGIVTVLYAHEGHVALPSRGAQVDAEKGYIILAQESRDAIDVRSTEIIRKSLPDQLLAYVQLVAPWDRHAFASSRLSGRIDKWLIQPGQTVQAGQILAEVVSSELENLQLDIRNAQSEIRITEQIVDVLKQSSGVTPVQELRDAETKLRQQQISLEVAKAKWFALGLNETDWQTLLQDFSKRIRKYPVRSPIRGTIIHADLSIGKVVQPGEHLVEIIDLSKIWAEMGLLEKDLPHVALGQAVTIHLTALPDLVLQGKIQVISYDLDAKTHLNSVWVELENPSDQPPKLLPGMTGRASITIPRPADTWTIPSTALINDGLSQYVLVEEAYAEKQSEYRRCNVVVLRQRSTETEIQSTDLFPGDRVVVQGAHELGNFFVPGVFKLNPEAERTIGLQTAVVGRATIDEVVPIDGQIEIPPDQRAAVSSPLNGNLIRLHTDRGQTVSKGSILAEVFSLEFQTLQLDLLKEHLLFELLDSQYQLLKTSKDLVSRKRLLDLEANWSASRNRRDNVRHRLEQIGIASKQIEQLLRTKQLLDPVPVQVPINGHVVRLEKVIGQSIRSEEPLLQVHQLRHPIAVGFASERDKKRIQLGQSARLQLVSDPKVILQGKVVRNSSILSVEDQSLAIWIELDSPLPYLVRQNQLLKIHTVVRSHRPTLAVPRSAIWNEGTQSFVFVRQVSSEWLRQPVVTGRSDDQYIEIRSGLHVGDTIAIQGLSGLQTAYASIR